MDPQTKFRREEGFQGNLGSLVEGNLGSLGPSSSQNSFPTVGSFVWSAKDNIKKGGSQGTVGSLDACVQLYTDLPNTGKVLLFVMGLWLLWEWFGRKQTRRCEGMTSGVGADAADAEDEDDDRRTQHDKFVSLQGTDVFDSFYASIYDELVHNDIRTEYEVGALSWRPSSATGTPPLPVSHVVDMGCGTGRRTHALHTWLQQTSRATKASQAQVTGVDVSPAMIRLAQRTYPSMANQFRVGDVLDPELFFPHTLSHIVCMYFTIYYVQDKRAFFAHCYQWLLPKGVLFLHVVAPDKFDPVLPPGNPLYIVSLQKYAKQRITQTNVTFHGFKYKAQYIPETTQEPATFQEQFQFDNGNLRKQTHTLYMVSLQTMLQLAQECGFVHKHTLDMGECAYEHQFIWILCKEL